MADKPVDDGGDTRPRYLSAAWYHVRAVELGHRTLEQLEASFCAMHCSGESREARAIQTALEYLKKNKTSEVKSAGESRVGSACISRELVLQMLGGVWPDSGLSEHWPSGFDWNSVDHFRCEGGYLVPYDGSHPLPGPDFKLTIV